MSGQKKEMAVQRLNTKGISFVFNTEGIEHPLYSRCFDFRDKEEMKLRWVLEKEKYYMISLYMKSKKRKKIQMNSFTKQRLTDLENELMLPKGTGEREGIVREFGMHRYTLLYIKWISNKVLLYSTGNSAQCHEAAWMEGEFGGERIHVYIYG